MSDSLIGKQLGDYQIRELLGRGGMARVYIGYDARLDRQAAVKVINSDFSPADRAEYFERFQREARAIARLNHPNIVGVYQFGQYEDSYYMAMVFVEGRDLRQILREYHDRRETPPLTDVLNVARGIGGALDYAHSRGVIHRDVKPSNIMLTRDNRSILTDFGLALTSSEGTRGETFGSAHYIAPEQAVSSAKAVPQSDLYSLGVCLYEMLTGQVPFDDPSAMTVALKHLQDPPPPPRTINANLSLAVEHVLLRALDKDPARRYPSGMELTRALEAALENEQLPATSEIDVAQVRAAVKTPLPSAKPPPAKTPPPPPPTYSPPPSIPPVPTLATPTDVGLLPRSDTTQTPAPTQELSGPKQRRRPDAIGQLLALLVILAVLGGGYMLARNSGLIHLTGLAGNTPSPSPGASISPTIGSVLPQTVQATVATTEAPDSALLLTETVPVTNTSAPSATDVPPVTPTVFAPATSSPIALLSPAATESVVKTATPFASATATNSPNAVSETASATSTTASADVLLVYDQGQLDLINLTTGSLSFKSRKLLFTQNDTAVAFDPSVTWLTVTDTLLPQHCYQVYWNSLPIIPTQFKDCVGGRDAFWGVSITHVFWAVLNGPPGTPTAVPPATFTVSIGGQSVVTCPVIDTGSAANSNPNSNQCRFALPG